MRPYAQAMFGAEARRLQDQAGSRAKFDAYYSHLGARQLDADAWAFLADRQSVYIASLTEDGWPYIQHRGGARGFLRRVDDTTIGFADYPGNKQFITQGNLIRDDRVSLFAMDYARRARLKVQGRARLVEAADDTDLRDRLWRQGDPTPERLFTLTVETFDWNCPKYIPQLFDEGQIQTMIGPEIDRLQARIADLEAQLGATGAQTTQGDPE